MFNFEVKIIFDKKYADIGRKYGTGTVPLFLYGLGLIPYLNHMIADSPVVVTTLESHDRSMAQG